MRGLSGSIVAAALATALAASGAAEAKVYIDEDFDAGRMPTGWEARASGTGYASYSFERRGGGYAFYAQVEAENGRYAAVELTAPQFTVKPRTLYYRFGFASSSYGSATAGKGFYVKYAGASSSFFYEGLPPASNWHFETGSFYVAEEKPIVAYWEISVAAAPGRYGSGSMWLDNVIIADDANFAVDPTSLGRVRALFR